MFADAMICLGFASTIAEMERRGCADETQWGQELMLSEA